MAAGIGAAPALYSRSSFLHVFSGLSGPYKLIVRPISSNFPLSRRRTPFALSPQARRGFSKPQESFASDTDLCFESPLKIVQYPDPKLRAKNKRFNTFNESLKKLVDEMFDVMYKTNGIGLSAPQVGMNVQLMVFNPSEEEEIVLINPVVFKASERVILCNEGCLSFPGIFADVVRPESVKVIARDITGARLRLNLSGLASRVFQHEFDHLQGRLFFDRMTNDVIDGIRLELKDLEKKYEELTGLPTPENVDNFKQIPIDFAKVFT